MDVVRVDELRGQLLEFTEDVFGSLTRAGWRERGECYLRGLMLDGKRKSIQPMAARLGVHEQALNHFVTVKPVGPDTGTAATRTADGRDDPAGGVGFRRYWGVEVG